jgi:hypothetical protein
MTKMTMALRLLVSVEYSCKIYDCGTIAHYVKYKENYKSGKYGLIN